MREFKSILYDIIPCWYELSLSKKPLGIILRIHQETIKVAIKIEQDAPIVVSYKKEFGFENFSSSFDKDFGFNNCFKYKGVKKDGFVEFFIKIPLIKIILDKTCEHCGGSGKDKYITSNRCLWCSGKGKEYIINWEIMRAISASFSVFSLLFHHCEVETSASKPQLLTFDTIARKEQHGGSINGEFSIPIMNWLKGFEPNTEFPDIAKILEETYKNLYGELERYYEYSFRAKICGTRGFLALDVPGDACGIHGGSHHFDDNAGSEFSCHNVDTPMQQLALLVGLTALHDKAREEIKA